MGCVAVHQICLSETPRLSSEVSPGMISPTIARWNFSFAELGSSRIESFCSQLGELISIQLFCRVHVFLANLESHVAYTKTVLSKQPFQHQPQYFLKPHHYHPFLREWVDVWNRKRLSHSYHRTQRCVSVELWMKMCLLGSAFEWYNPDELQIRRYFEDVLLWVNLSSTIGSGLCFFKNHQEMSITQALLLLVRGETDFQSFYLNKV